MTKKSRCRKTEYQKEFKKSAFIVNIPNYIENKKYRAARRNADYVHTPFLWEDSSSSTSSSESDVRFQNLGDKRDAAVQKEQTFVDCEVQTSLSSDESQDEAPKQRLEARGRTHDLKLKGRKDAGNSNRQVQHTSKSTDEVKGKTYQRQCPRRPDRSSKYISAQPHTKSVLSRASSSSLKPPFVAYGWADKEDEITRHRTYNILSARDVHPSAVRASRRLEQERQGSWERDLAKRKKKKQALGVLLPKVQSTCGWETEYSAHFKYDPKSFGFH